MITASKIKAKPFLKWAGGKRQLLSQYEQFFPKELKNRQIEKYVEPFLGSGAVFFHIADKYEVNEFYISDINPELVLTYRVIKDNPQNLINLLREYENDYRNISEEEQKEKYYTIRNSFNMLLKGFDYLEISSNAIERAAQIIFLNRTCFNGLFRVNSKGEFNVPIGKYKNPTICDEENIFAVSELLQNVNIKYGDYRELGTYVNERSFIYFDPPYLPISETSFFTSYSNNIFGERQQVELAQYFAQLNETGAKLMLSNSSPENNFFEENYMGFNIHSVNASRMINSNGLKRGEIKELLITNYR